MGYILKQKRFEYILELFNVLIRKYSNLIKIEPVSCVSDSQANFFDVIIISVP